MSSGRHLQSWSGEKVPRLRRSRSVLLPPLPTLLILVFCQLKHSSLEIASWRDKTRLAFFRQILQGGFLPHMTHNSILHEVSC